MIGYLAIAFIAGSSTAITMLMTGWGILPALIGYSLGGAMSIALFALLMLGQHRKD
ncbi:hypothetical protein NBRC116601_33250 [Cognatishimia sp. WU-CL00825]|uniref:hypothetical protein n=1 Tax=Cognatishimia sp. WU-CL00825 TaxID=3127658 RepID=UPI00310C77ED